MFNSVGLSFLDLHCCKFLPKNFILFYKKDGDWCMMNTNMKHVRDRTKMEFLGFINIYLNLK